MNRLRRLMRRLLSCTKMSCVLLYGLVSFTGEYDIFHERVSSVLQKTISVLFEKKSTVSRYYCYRFVIKALLACGRAFPDFPKSLFGLAKEPLSQPQRASSASPKRLFRKAGVFPLPVRRALTVGLTVPFRSLSSSLSLPQRCLPSPPRLFFRGVCRRPA